MLYLQNVLSISLVHSFLFFCQQENAAKIWQWATQKTFKLFKNNKQNNTAENNRDNVGYNSEEYTRWSQENKTKYEYKGSFWCGDSLCFREWMWHSLPFVLQLIIQLDWVLEQAQDADGYKEKMLLDNKRHLHNMRFQDM